jgi:mannose/fructose-specific phosphotransferase system component IIA
MMAVFNPRAKILVVSHGAAAKGMVQAVTELLHDPDLADDFTALELEVGEPKAAVVAKITEAVDALDVGKGVIVAVDLHGSTPFNAAIDLQQASPHRVCVVSGYNLAMLVKLASMDRSRAIGDVAEGGCATALRSIKLVAPGPDAVDAPVGDGEEDEG